MTAGPDTLFPPGLDSTLYGSTGTDFLDDEFHATQHRRVEQAMLELQKMSQIPWFDWSVIWDGGSNYVGRNHRTAEAVYSGSALHSVWGSVRTYANALAAPGARVLIQKNGATNAEIPVLDTLNGFPGCQLYMAGYGKRNQAAGGTGPADTNVILKVPSSGSSFTLGAGTAVLDFMGTDGIENWTIDGVSVDANNKADVALLFKGKGTANGGMIFRGNYRGGAVDCLRLGPGTTDSADVFVLGTQVSHNGTGNGERALVAVLAGDAMMAYNNFAVPQGNANALLIAANLWIFGTHAGGGGSSNSAIKATGGTHTSIIGMYLDNQTDTVHGAVWVVPSSNAMRALNILQNRFNPNAGTPFVVFDGTSVGAARGVVFATVSHNWTKGNPAAAPPNPAGRIPAIVKFINYFSTREAVSIEMNQFLNTSKVWTHDGTGSGVPWTWGNKIHPTDQDLPLPAGMYGENFVTGVLNGAGPLAIPHRLYATPEIVVPGANKVGSVPVGRISAYADDTNVYVISSSSETSLPVSVIVKVIGS